MATKNNTNVNIEPPKFEEVRFKIVGVTPLMTNPFSNKARISLPDAPEAEKPSVKPKKKAPVVAYNEMMDSLYWLTEKPNHGADEEEAEKIWNGVKYDAAFGFPVTGIKQSIITGAYRAGLDVKMTELRATFWLRGDTENSTQDLAEIIAPPPELRIDIGRNSGMTRSAKHCFRPEFETWEIPLVLKYIKNGKYTLSQILNLVNYGGFASGIGEWRPERDGQHGMYELKVE